jgi:Protein ChrB, N-terminal
MGATYAALRRNLRYINGVGWLLLTYKLAAERSSARVAVWREVRRSGALQLQKSVVAFPDTAEFRTAAIRVRAVVADVGGTVLALRAEALNGEDEARLEAAWNEARAAEYAELAAECEKLVAEIDKEFAKEKFTLAELDEEEAELEKLGSWHQRIRARDVHSSEGGAEAEAALKRAAEAVSRFTTAVFDRTHG